RRTGHDGQPPGPTLRGGSLDRDGWTDAVRAVPGTDDRQGPDLRRSLQHEGAAGAPGGETGGVREGQVLVAGRPLSLARGTQAPRGESLHSAPACIASATAMAAANARAIPARSMRAESARKKPAKAKRPRMSPLSTAIADCDPWK